MKHQSRLPTALLFVGAAGLCAAAGGNFTDDDWPRGRGDRHAASDAAGPGHWVPALQGPPPAPAARQTGRIRPADLVRVQVFQVDELSSEERVDADGRILLPLLGPVAVAGLTPREAAARIAAILRKDYLQDPRVDVDLKESANQQVTVLGSVKRSGVFPLQGETSLLQAIALAQGFDPLAKQSGVLLFRADAAGRPVAYVVDAAAVQRGELRDPVLVGGDRVVVPESGGAVLLKGATDTLRALLRIPF
ncbi:polysaccharide biosynthesis/export family protein [uncultured Thiodictyon sp.]|jgi:polysaccharide export outer membrane protein|uniref:polysaccharide biosynthesis/export family protein n=1 Tax=uncultured Thiodictyon sp. TaxID=1846217 RepID=UPI0025FE7D9F|nr:polysaccharide biosynthesis/export family protein [uncultured Thiodictyon sp.]